MGKIICKYRKWRLLKRFYSLSFSIFVRSLLHHASYDQPINLALNSLKTSTASKTSQGSWPATHQAR
eukprot:scaffold344_cov132-Skeletonema_menzelii.AAC.4